MNDIADFEAFLFSSVFPRPSQNTKPAKDGDELVVFSGGEGHMGATLV